MAALRRTWGSRSLAQIAEQLDMEEEVPLAQASQEIPFSTQDIPWTQIEQCITVPEVEEVSQD